jgi:ubiquitin C-terminal hydrolase
MPVFSPNVRSDFGDSEVFTEDNYIDRSSWVQATSRLTGIHNLSNTCYMNSLVNQLFMNINFRNFIFNVDVSDPQGTQNLLHQLQYLFARLLHGNDKAAYPRELAHSIIDFEGAPINIHVQMDVDEFFNLLFDRIESQIKAPEERIQFRKLYGGVLCHTIKSRECSHVSTREEDFAAIQCDVRGKTTLEESLASYVMGEMMVGGTFFHVSLLIGDNKYSCEACGRHVDAVKQISMKSLPDNLIFHLKRFEYAVDIGKRIKVNDYFQFPREIDLFPYTLNHIEMREQGIQQTREETEQIYDLVGVLVHTGTAESGHYYSYIRDPRQESDPDPDANPQWFEFNDSEVKPWRVEDLDHWCFGGQEVNFDPTYFPEPPLKSYSAYMLFYRKRPKPMNGLDMTLSVKSPSPELKVEVQRSNDLFTRRYVLYGDDLTAFVAKLLNTMPQNDTSPVEDCEIADLEDQTGDLLPLALGLKVYRRVVSRLDFRSSVEKYCTALKSAVCSSPAARHYFYAWLRRTPGCLKELLLSNINDKARLQSAQLISSALTSEQVAKPRNLDEDNPIHQLDLQEVSYVIGELVELVYSAGDNWRTWSEYFEALALIAKDPEYARFLIEQNMIANCLYHFMHNLPRVGTPPAGFSRLKYPDNDRVRPSYKKLIHFVSMLLQHVVVPEVNQDGDHNFSTLHEPGWITDDEWGWIFLDTENEYMGAARRNAFNWLTTRMFETACDTADMTRIIKWMLWQCLSQPNMSHSKAPIVYDLYRHAEPSHMFVAETLEIVWKLFDAKLEEEDVAAKWRAMLLNLVKRLGQWTEYLRDCFYAQEWLSFWKNIYEYDDVDFHNYIITKLPDIIAQLIYSNDAHVRDQAVQWVNDIVHEFLEDEDIPDNVFDCLGKLYARLSQFTELFLDRKFTINERIPSLSSVANPVLAVLQLILLPRPDAEENQPKLACMHAPFASH